MRLKDFFKKSPWQTKAVSRSKKINSLTKRNKELIKSRDKVKEKYIKLQIEQEDLKRENLRLENELKKI